MSAHTDTELFHAIAAGNEKAFEQLFSSYRNKVYTIALKITGSTELAEEVLLDVFLKVWIKREQLPHIEHFSAWLFTVTRNRVFKTLKQQALHAAGEAITGDDDLLLSHTHHPGVVLVEKEYWQVLHEAVAQLSPQQKKVYHLIKENGLKREEAAAALNLSPETVKRHLAEAMHAIRAYCSYHLGTYAAILIIKELL